MVDHEDRRAVFFGDIFKTFSHFSVSLIPEEEILEAPQVLGVQVSVLVFLKEYPIICGRRPIARLRYELAEVWLGYVQDAVMGQVVRQAPISTPAT